MRKVVIFVALSLASAEPTNVHASIVPIANAFIETSNSYVFSTLFTAKLRYGPPFLRCQRTVLGDSSGSASASGRNVCPRARGSPAVLVNFAKALNDHSRDDATPKLKSKAEFEQLVTIPTAAASLNEPNVFRIRSGRMQRRFG